VFPALEAYLAGLPDGLESFPTHRAKASLIRTALGLHSFNPRQLDALPDRLRELATDPPTSNRWVLEVEHMAMSLALAEAHGWSDRDFAKFWYRMTKAMINNVLYAGLLRALSPKMLLRTASLRWAVFHKGVTLQTKAAPAGLYATLSFPAGLVPPVCIGAYAQVLQAVVDASGTPAAAFLVEMGPTKAVYLMSELD